MSASKIDTLPAEFGNLTFDSEPPPGYEEKPVEFLGYRVVDYLLNFEGTTNQRVNALRYLYALFGKEWIKHKALRKAEDQLAEAKIQIQGKLKTYYTVQPFLKYLVLFAEETSTPWYIQKQHVDIIKQNAMLHCSHLSCAIEAVSKADMREEFCFSCPHKIDSDIELGQRAAERKLAHEARKNELEEKTLLFKQRKMAAKRMFEMENEKREEQHRVEMARLIKERIEHETYHAKQEQKRKDEIEDTKARRQHTLDVVTLQETGSLVKRQKMPEED